MADERANRFNLQLDDEHATELLATALDQPDADAATITGLLDAIPGAWERAQEGLGAARAGGFVPPDEL